MKRCIFDKEPLIDFDKLIRGKNINFLIGSGASAYAYPTLSLSSELKNMILKDEEIDIDNINSFEDIITSPKISPEKKGFLYFYFYHNWIKKMFDTVDEIKKEKNEYSYNLNFYTKFIQKMFIFLQNESNDRPKRMNIFTTNYDLFFELAYDKIFHSVPLGFLNDGSKGIFDKIIDIKNFYLNISHSGFNDEYRYEIPTLNLLKIHGSISWIKDEVLDNKDNKIKEILKMENNLTKSELYENLKSCYKEILEQKKYAFLLKNIDQSSKKISEIIDYKNIWNGLEKNKDKNPEEYKEFKEDEEIIENNIKKKFDELINNRNILTKLLHNILKTKINNEKFREIISDKNLFNKIQTKENLEKLNNALKNKGSELNSFKKNLNENLEEAFKKFKTLEKEIWDYIIWEPFINKIIDDENLLKKLKEKFNYKNTQKKLNKALDDESNKLYDKFKTKILLEKLEEIIEYEFIKEFNEIINEIINEYKLNIKNFNEKFEQLCIINPDKNKFAQTVLQQHYYQMLRSFSYELEKEHTVLIVFGFSFKDEHITNILERSLSNPKLTVYVIPYDKKTYDEINEKFPNYNNFKFLLCHGNNESWCLEKQKFNKDDIKGDFEFLTEYLFKFIELEE